MTEPEKTGDQNDAPKQVTILTYMPHGDDPDETVVDGITFKAYEPIDIGEDKAWLAAKLEGNPWFTTGKADEERKAQWSQARKIEQDAKAASEVAMAASADPVAEAFRASAHIDKLRTPPAGSEPIVLPETAAVENETPKLEAEPQKEPAEAGKAKTESKKK